MMIIMMIVHLTRIHTITYLLISTVSHQSQNQSVDGTYNLPLNISLFGLPCKASMVLFS